MNRQNHHSVLGTYSFWLGMVCLAGLHVAISLMTGNVFEGELVDSDCYMHLHRVQSLFASGDWFDPTIRGVLPPEGHVQHWTRQYDLILLTGALVLKPFFGFEGALYWWGVWISPVLHLFLFASLMWIGEAVVDKEWWPLCAVTCLVALTAVYATFQVGRPDHQALLLVYFAVSLGALIRIARNPDRVKWGLLAGVVGAAGLWVGVQALIFVVFAIVAVGLLWLGYGTKYLRVAMVLAWALFLSILAALLVERGLFRFFEVQYDTLSVAHLLCFGVHGVFWSVIYFAQNHFELDSLKVRAGLSLGLATVGLGLLAVLVPGMFGHPLAESMNEFYRQTRLAHLDELKSAVVWFGGQKNWGLQVGYSITHFGLPVVSVMWLLGRFDRSRIAGRLTEAIFLGVTLVYLALAFTAVRWSPYVQIGAAIPYVAMMADFGRWLKRRLSESARIWIAPVVFSYLLGVWPLAVLAFGQQKTSFFERQFEQRVACSGEKIASYLQQKFPEPGLVLTSVELGAEILYRTHHRVMSIANHRAQPGFRATYKFFRDTSPRGAEAHEVAREYGVDIIVACDGLGQRAYFGDQGSSTTLYERLVNGKHPDFVAPVVKNRDSGIWIYAVENTQKKF